MRILMTGGAGFLGRAVARAIVDGQWPDVDLLTVYSRDEAKQHHMRGLFGDGSIRYLLGDVRDSEAMMLAMTGHDVVLHAAAVKFIPEAERNVLETVRVNVEGSRVVLEAARRSGVAQVVGISTDKAVEPVNTYGMTKALMERMFAEAHEPGRLRTVCVRYGNVLGSTGSVVQTFLRQLEDAGSVSITDPTMTRFWLSPRDAVAILQWALADERGYSGVYVPACLAMAIGDVAKAVGAVTDKAFVSTVIGARPGEKPHETLIGWQESVRTHKASSEYGGKGFVVMPATTHPVPYSEHWTYTSDRAQHQLAGWMRQHIRHLIEEGEL